MTHARLIHLAALAEEAAAYSDNPPRARHLAGAAADARRMAEAEARCELVADLHRMLDDINVTLGR